MTETDERRDRNIEVFKAMLEACGRKDFDRGLYWLTEDVYCDWPYRPIPDMDEVMTGRETLKRFFIEGQKPFAGLNYRIDAIYELVDPDVLIAEYSSDSRHLATGVPYRNCYLGIFRFREGRICFWREYINPLAIKDVLDAVART